MVLGFYYSVLWKINFACLYLNNNWKELTREATCP